MDFAATLTTWLQVVGTLIAAMAALASWAAVVASRRLSQESRRPALHIELSRVTGAGVVDGTAAVTIPNAGSALATRVGFILVTPFDFAQEDVASGFLRPGEVAYFSTDVKIGEEFQAVVFARSPDGEVYVWDHNGQRRRLKPEGQMPTWEEILGCFYPGVDFSGRREAEVFRSA